MTPYHEKYFRYQGRSMWPGFQDGDLLEIEPVDTAQLRVGDCLLFPDDRGQLVVHRLIALRDGLRTRGDASATPDPCPVLPEQVLGRVVCRYRHERRTRVARRRLGLLAAIFYRYAGRLDPARQSRGGRLAKAMRGLSMVVLRPLWRRGKVRKLQGLGQEPIVVWMLGRKVIGQQDPATGEWQLRWPWRVFVAPAALSPDPKKT